MAHDPVLLDRLEALDLRDWIGHAYRYTSGRRPPERENTLGARWNPREVAAIYVSLEKETVLAEFAHLLDALSPRPSQARFTLYELEVRVERVADLRDAAVLEQLGVSWQQLASDDFSACQRVGAAAAWLKIGGLLVPSARRTAGSNLIVFSHNQEAAFAFNVLSDEDLGS